MKGKINGYLLTWIVSSVLAVGIAYGMLKTHAHDNYMPRPEMEQIVKRLDIEINRLHEEINRLYDIK